ncbi:MAG: CBS domain-containing protein [Candidatus Schekmanbacteria bacterium]|nr:CBS domain-containing protein [Candidatus Schekmanbacteria bacterium]
MLVSWIPDRGELRPEPYLPGAAPRKVEAIVATTASSAVHEEAIAPPLPSARLVASEYARQTADHARSRAHLVEHIMTSPVLTIEPQRPIATALRVMQDHELDHLPVTSPGGHLVGLLSKWYVLRAGQAHGDAQPLDATRLASLTVDEVMTRSFVTATPDTAIRDVAHAMVDAAIHCIPVVTDFRHVVGIVTASDMLRCMVNSAPLDLWT